MSIPMILEAFQLSIGVKQKILSDESLLEQIEQVAKECVIALKGGGRVLFCGNGGSAADAQHLAAEMSGRYYYDRPSLDAEALHVNTSYITAVANDYSFEDIFSRLLQAKGRKGDVLIAISTSGNSANVLKALKTAREKGMVTVGMTGKTGGKMNAISDFCLKVPSTDTPRIQEAHITIGHVICKLVEFNMFLK